jgi:arylsulfatase A-like enzyme
MPGTDAAYLGTKWAPFETIADPAKDGPFTIPNLGLPEGISVERLDERRSLLNSMDKLRRDADENGQFDAVDRFRQQAFGLLTSDRARNAFDLDSEPRSVRERYGFYPEFKAPTPDRCGCPAWSQRILLARRLVEAGVRLVTVDLRWWDTHAKGFESLKDGFLSRWDQAYSALIEDLDQRGLLNTTMVVAWGEFGRTPKVNDKAGRDHWSNVFSAALAGGGIQGGRVVGSSDPKGGEPKDNPKSPGDVLATMYRHLGVDTTVNYSDHTGRPHPVLPEGTPIGELF